MRTSGSFCAVLTAFLGLAAHVMADGQGLGCFDALPGSFQALGEYSWQSSKYCASQCSGYDYFALYNGNQCFCGSSAPSGGADGSCDISCVGYPSETCGGSGSYNVFAQAGVQVNQGGSAEGDASSSTSSTANETSTSAVNETTHTTAATQTTNATTTAATTTSSSSSTAAATTTTHTHDTTTKNEETSPTTEATPTTSDGITTERYTTVIENSSSVITSFVYVTKSAANGETASGVADSSSASGSSSKGSSKGAIIGGVVGGVVGALAIGLALFFILRHRRQSDSYDDAESMMADDEAYEAALKSNPFASAEDVEADSMMMLGRRRLSEGSLADTADYGMKVLRVANPDDM